ncbi:response regulator transcription factor [Lichenihabitans sp. Uapishka_5]|uniref:response regulator transcription factor n=1 Tax=Lichenihabitans sp. Uapishka_5 TaxID=3037302 RepID=UPI0029E7D7F8|nr:response regulator transcription factor [Lichenihabitans sp. Uapishka_5]MDX7950704.1 response regulator transcription factor [Lichenihabitans sp. Uapishka_5]
MSGPEPDIAAAALRDDAQHLLLVDDDRRIRELLARFVAKDGYRVTLAGNADEAWSHLKHFAFDLIVLDAMMPGQNGFDFATELRRASDVPILMLTARAEADDKVRGFEAGVDDYLTKPYEPRELLLRIASILRRAVPRAAPRANGQAVRFGDFVFEVERGELRQGDAGVRISEREREILTVLAAARGDTVSREALGASGESANERTIDVQINRLRRKIERDPAEPLLLQTVRGMGYRLVVDL